MSAMCVVCIIHTYFGILNLFIAGREPSCNNRIPNNLLMTVVVSVLISQSYKKNTFCRAFTSIRERNDKIWILCVGPTFSIFYNRLHKVLVSDKLKYGTNDTIIIMHEL